jgi:hypothetical protein
MVGGPPQIINQVKKIPGHLTRPYCDGPSRIAERQAFHLPKTVQAKISGQHLARGNQVPPELNFAGGQKIF